MAALVQDRVQLNASTQPENMEARRLVGSGKLRSAETAAPIRLIRQIIGSLSGSSRVDDVLTVLVVSR